MLFNTGTPRTIATELSMKLFQRQTTTSYNHCIPTQLTITAKYLKHRNQIRILHSQVISNFYQQFLLEILQDFKINSERIPIGNDKLPGNHRPSTQKVHEYHIRNPILTLHGRNYSHLDR